MTGNPEGRRVATGETSWLGLIVTLRRVMGTAERAFFERVATHGRAQDDLNAECAQLDADPPDTLDAVRDLPNMSLDEEPQRVRDDLESVSRQR